jgi:Mlc titration factor MtfA (ptsG expression regulator)
MHARSTCTLRPFSPTSKGGRVASGWFHNLRHRVTGGGPSARPVGWEQIAADALTHWRFLDDAERSRLGAIIETLLRKRWEAAQGFALSDEIRVTIAAQAALIAIGLDDDCYRDVTSVIVHPTTVVLRGQHAGPVPGVLIDESHVLGMASDRRGPVIIAWDAARAGARHPERGHNVVFHEFAHKLDMLDRVVDGTPPLPDDESHRRWVEVCTHEYEQLRLGASSLLSDYAATDPGEFFAVATELFFDRSADLREQHPELYEVLAGYYRQDPASRRVRT